MPRLAAFPKAFMDELCVEGTMSLDQWIGMAATLDLDGLEFYSGFLDLKLTSSHSRFRQRARMLDWRFRCFVAPPISPTLIPAGGEDRSNFRNVGSKLQRS